MNEHELVDRIFELLEELKEEIYKNKYALDYYNALDIAIMFGLQGLKTQVRYILTNIRVPRSKQHIKKQLLKLTK
ncbi:MAG: hypothetical protein ACTSR0_04205 [Candidatus Asgardarchaeia archaeon]